MHKTAVVTSDQAPRRHWYQRLLRPRFSLRMMLIIVAMFSLTVALVRNWLHNTWRQQHVLKVIKQSLKLNETDLHRPPIELYYDYEYEAMRSAKKHISHLQPPEPNVLSRFFDKDHFHNVINAQIIFTENLLKDDESNILKTLTELPKLRMLNCSFYVDDKITQKQFTFLSQMENLEELSLTGAGRLIEREQIDYLKKLPKLKKLQLNWQSSHADMLALSELNNLEELRLHGPDISPNRLRQLKRLVKLRKFSIDEFDARNIRYPPNKLSVNQVRAISEQFPNLESLYLYNDFEAENLESLNKMPKLKKLYVKPFLETEDLSEVIPKIEIIQKYE